jgi:exopolysaccharide production protein ExoZ
MFSWVQVLRGIAATLVVCVHYAESQAVKGAAGAEWLTRFGASGVDVFFVISGFIMMHSQSDETRRLSAGSFLMHRFTRIAPLYWALTSIAFLLATLAGSLVNARYGLSTFVASMLFLPYSDSYLLMSSYAFKAYVLPMAWTLTYEWYFYVVFSITLLLRFKSSARMWLFLAWFCSATLLGSLVEPLPLILQVLTSPLVFEFLFGCAISLLYTKGIRVGAVVACIAASAGMLVLFKYEPDSSFGRAMVWGGAAFCLVAAATLYARQQQQNPWWACVRLGDISYSLYLSHFFTVALFVRIQSKVGLLNNGFGLPAIVAFIVLSIVAAELCFRLIEEPARHYFKRRAKRLVVA